jgi:hypothetical protein
VVAGAVVGVVVVSLGVGEGAAVEPEGFAPVVVVVGELTVDVVSARAAGAISAAARLMAKQVTSERTAEARLHLARCACVCRLMDTVISP